MFVKPAANPAFDEKAPEAKANPSSLLVYDPALRDYLPAFGRDVGADHDLYWHRRVLQGDVLEITGAEYNAGIQAEAARLKAEKARLDAEAAAPAPDAKAKQAAPTAVKEGK